MATDSHVVSPLFFASGDIGSLSVHGTINDVAMMGALYLPTSFILKGKASSNKVSAMVNSHLSCLPFFVCHIASFVYYPRR